MFNPFKKSEKSKNQTSVSVCYVTGTVEVVLINQKPTFQVTLVESGLVWELSFSQLGQLLLHSVDETDIPFFTVTDDIKVKVGEVNTFKGSFPLELILLQLLGFSVSRIDSRFYARCPGTEDFYFTVNHAGQIPGIENYREINFSVEDAA